MIIKTKPNQEEVNVAKLLVMSYFPIASVYATWRIEKFWLFFFINSGMGVVVGAFANEFMANSTLLNAIILLSVLGTTALIWGIAFESFAKKFNNKIRQNQPTE